MNKTNIISVSLAVLAIVFTFLSGVIASNTMKSMRQIRSELESIKADNTKLVDSIDERITSYRNNISEYKSDTRETFTEIQVRLNEISTQLNEFDADNRKFQTEFVRINNMLDMLSKASVKQQKLNKNLMEMMDIDNKRIDVSHNRITQLERHAKATSECIKLLSILPR